MKSKVPIVKNTITLKSLLWQLAFVIPFILLVKLFINSISLSTMIGALISIIIIYLLRYFLIRDHARGFKLVKMGQFEKAIPCFNANLLQLSKRPWIDKYRYFLLACNSPHTFREIDLCNIAFCYGQLGDLQKAKKYYELVLEEYPENNIATTAMKFIGNNNL